MPTEKFRNKTIHMWPEVLVCSIYSLFKLQVGGNNYGFSKVKTLDVPSWVQPMGYCIYYFTAH